MNYEIMKFYERLKNNIKFREKLQKSFKNIHSEKELKNFIELEIIPLAKENNYKFTSEDLINYEKESLKRLSNEDLLNVAGGVSPKSLILSGGLFALVLLGSGAIHGTTAHAALPTTTIKNSVENLTDEKPINNDKKEKIIDVDSITQTKQVEELTVNPASIKQNDSYIENQNPVREKMSQENIMESSEILTEASHQDEHNNNVDMEYITERLNLLDPYVYNLTKTTEKFRFLDGSKKQIIVGPPRGDSIPAWEFNKDEGEGSTNFMRCLFPSSAGNLNSEGGIPNLPSFSKDCNPESKMIANIAGYIYNYVRSEDKKVVKGAEKGLNNIIKILENSDKNKCDDVKIFFKDYLHYELDDNFINTDKDIKKLKTYLYLLKNATYMIQEQEIIDDQKINFRSIPKYTTEKMLMSYFIQHFNNKDDVNQFYNEVKKIILKNDNINSNNNLDRLTKITKILNKVSKPNSCPYSNILVSNGTASIIKSSNTNKLKFTSGIFPDCADIVVRHIINLLSYDNKDKWKFILENLSPETEQNLQNEIINVCNAIKNYSTIDKKPLKDRLIQFFYYQELNGGADIASQVSRTFWNYVISNMSKKSDDFVYEINYSLKNNELDSGWINCLKLTYNILYALKATDPSFENKLTNAKNKIDDLDKDFKNKKDIQTLTLKLEEAIKATFSIMTNVQVESFDEIKIDKKDIFSAINISKCDENNNILFTFSILQGKEHAQIDYSPYKVVDFTEQEDNLKEFMVKDPIAQLLADLFNVSCESTSDFNSYFGPLFNPNNNYSSCSFCDNYKALRFLKNIQGNGNDILAINRSLKNSSIDIFCNTQATALNSVDNNKKTLLKFIYDNYINNKWSFINFLNVITKSTRLYAETEEEKNSFNKAFEEYINILKMHMFDNFEIITDGNNCISCKIKPDGTVAVLYLKNDSKITVPNEVFINGKTYTVSEMLGTVSYVEEIAFQHGFKTLSIGTNAFINCYQLKKITIPDSVTSLKIQNEAFACCNNLLAFNIPSSVKTLSIGFQAFDECTSLMEFVIPHSVNSLTIAQEAFVDCFSLNKFIINATNITELSLETRTFENCPTLNEFNITGNIGSLHIGNQTFTKCYSLNKFNITGNVDSLFIGNQAFIDCEALNEFNINNIKNLSIDKNAFTGCSALSKFNIPSSITFLSIGDNAFSDCTALKTFTVLGSLTELIIENSAFKNCSSLSEFNILNSVNYLYINKQAFAECSQLTVFNIIGSIISLSIGENAFYGCNQFTEFNVNGSVDSLNIGIFAFSYCEAFQKFNVTNTVNSLLIDNSAFEMCSELNTFNVPNAITIKININAFNGCSSLTCFNVPESVTTLELERNAFNNCSALESFSIPHNINLLALNISEEAFQYCSNLKTFFVPASVRFLNIDKSAFKECISLESFNIDTKIKASNISIHNFAFQECTALKNFYIPYVTDYLMIYESAFDECTALESFIINGSIKYLNISNKTFKDCYKLSEFKILSPITNLNIDNNAFENCNSLKTFNVPHTVKYLYIREYAFYNCISLSIFNEHNSVEFLHIGENSFNFCTSLETFNVSNSAKHIDIRPHAFEQCKSLKTFNIPTSVTELSLQKNAFDSCTSLQTFNIFGTLASLNLGDNIFHNCSKLSEFNIWSTITELNIGKGAFENCTSMQKFIIPNVTKKLSIGNNSFCNCCSLISFNITKYIQFLSISQNAFMKCESLVSFDIDAKINSLYIGPNAFNGCSSLTKFSLPESVKYLSISEFSFSNCTALTKFIITNIVSLSIGPKAFDGCSALVQFVVPKTVENKNIDPLAFDENTHII